LCAYCYNDNTYAALQLDQYVPQDYARAEAVKREGLWADVDGLNRRRINGQQFLYWLTKHADPELLPASPPVTAFQVLLHDKRSNPSPASAAVDAGKNGVVQWP
jgi:hypothetical protein